jgi:tetratricopeptide (TPR) repeat protein
VIRVLLLSLLLPTIVWAGPPKSAGKRPAQFKIEKPLPGDVEKAILIAEQLEKEQSYDAARRQLAAVLPNVPLKRAASFWIRICHLWEMEEASLQARDCYRDLAKRLEPVDIESAALASYRAAVILSKTKRYQITLNELVDLILKAPTSVAAQRSVFLARDLHRTLSGPPDEAMFLIGMAAQLEARHLNRSKKEERPYIRRLIAQILVAAGKVLIQDLNKPKDALDVLTKASKIGNQTVWWDDAIIWQARAAVADRSYDRGLALYEELMNSRESSWFVGSYDSEFMDDAFFEYGDALKKANRLNDARKAFRKLIKEIPESRLRDDAAYELVMLAPNAQRKQSLTLFLKQYPDSRHAKSAKKALKQ